MSDIVSEVYDQSSNLGKTYATIQLMVGICIFVILCIGGLYFEFKPNTSANIDAKIVKVISCDRNVNNNINSKNNTSSESVNYNCNLQVSYTVKDQPYNNNVSLSKSTPYLVGETVSISYNLNDPNNISGPQGDNQTMGSISIVIAILILSSCGVNYYLSTRSKLYAATQGVATSANILSSVFKH